MSLKAKIEAVIYASEEPVTLGQLVGLLGLEAQAELDSADERQGRLALEASEHLVVGGEEEPGDLDALTAETLGFEVEPAATADLTDVPSAEQALETAEEQTPDSDDQQGQPTQISQDTEAPDWEAAALSPAETRARERRLRDYVRSVLDQLMAEYKSNDRGLEVREIAGGYRFATKPEYHDAVRGFVRSLKPPLKLSLQALETLAVVAYKQPVTAPEVSEVRGVDSGGVLGSLLARKLVATAGRKQVIGRPILYKTTKEFLLRFGLKDVSELPSIEEFERMASDMNVALQEEIPMPDQPVVPVGTPVESGRLSTAEIERDVDPNAEASRNTHLSQADGDPNPSTPTADEVSAEHLTPAPDGPSEFTGNESVPPAQNTTTDGRISGVPPVYNTPTDEMTDSPANDAAVQGAAEEGDL